MIFNVLTADNKCWQ